MQPFIFFLSLKTQKQKKKSIKDDLNGVKYKLVLMYIL